MNKITFSSEGDKYQNFHVKQIKDVQKFKAEYFIHKLLALKDGRIIVFLNEENENEENNHYKLCVYSPDDGFSCDINKDITETISEFFQMEDGNLLILFKDHNEIVKIKKASIDIISTFEQKLGHIKKLLNDNFFTKTKNKGKKKSKSDFRYACQIYKYEKEQFYLFKDISSFWDKEGIDEICQINQNELALYSKKKGKLFGYNEFLVFYDMNSEKITKTIKVGNGENLTSEIFLINEDHLLFEKENNYIIVDIKNKIIKSTIEFPCQIFNFLNLNEKQFLAQGDLVLFQCENVNLDTYKIKEQKKFVYELVSRYNQNRLISYKEKEIIIFDCIQE